MLVKFITAEEEYKRNKELKKEDVESLKQWMSKQNHLPTISGNKSKNKLGNNFK